MTLYEKIGKDFIERAIEEFYKRAFSDPMISHFFMGKDRESITQMQQSFAIAMLGGPKEYSGLPLKDAHLPFTIKPPHFGRRQVLMGEVLRDMELDDQLAKAWLDLEESLRPLIVNVTC
jgi:truncated hemoglobin YjbI